MRHRLVVALCILSGWQPAWAACAGPPYDQFDFWLGAWHDPAAPPAEHYTVRRTAGGCAIEEVLTGANGQTQGIGLSGWDSERRTMAAALGGQGQDRDSLPGRSGGGGTVVLTSEPKGRRNAVALHLPEHPARSHRRRLCLSASAKTDPGPRCGRVTSIGSDRRESNCVRQLSLYANGSRQNDGCCVACRRIIWTRCTRDSNALIMRVAASWNIPLAT